MKIQMMSKKGSNSAKVIYDNTSVKKAGNTKTKPDLLINYGMPSEMRRRLLARHRHLSNVPTINAFCCYNKYKSISMAKNAGIRVPDSKRSLGTKDISKDWLVKKEHSIGGKGISIANGKKPYTGRYYQKYIRDRKYELRVHAFSWIEKSKWSVQRRVGDKDTVAWNFSNGGRFSTVHNKNEKPISKAIDISSKILDIFKMEFGAIDLIVDKKDNVYFIEINSQPGMGGLSESIYVSAIKELEKIDSKKLKKFFIH